MSAAVYRGPRRIAVEARAVPAAPAPDEVLVAPVLVGLCGTDRGIYVGRYRARAGVTLGHEAVGVVLATGSDRSPLRRGQRVVLDPTQWCGRCPECRSGATRFCRRKGELEIGIARDGALAERLVVPSSALRAVPEGMSSAAAVLVEPLACVMNACAVVRLAPSDRVAVLGAGPLGLLWALAAGRRARSVRVLEIDGYRRRFAAELLGDAAMLDRPEPSVADVVVDTSGSALGTAIELAADGGRIVLMGCDITAAVRVEPFVLTARGLTLVGAADYDAAMFPRALALAQQLGGERLITHRFGLDDLPLALDHLSPDERGYRAVKVVIAPQARRRSAGSARAARALAAAHAR